MNFDAASAIETLDFPELIAIERSLRIYSVNALSTINFPKLQQVLENVTIEGMQSLQSVDFPELTGTGVCTLTNLNSLTQVSAPKLETVAGMSLTGAATLTAVNLPALNTVTGNLSMSAASLTVLQFPTLTTVDGTLTLTTPLLTSLRLPSLRKVGTFAAADLQSLGILDVRGMDIGTLSFAYTTLVRTKGIKLIGDETFNGNLSLVFALAATAPASAPAFPVTVEGIKVVGGLEIVGNPGNSQIPITAIEFDWLERVTGLLYFYNLNKVTRIELPNLQEVGGLKISLTNLETLLLPKLEEITGYTSGTTAAGDFDYTVSNNNITALELSKLKSVVGDISITGLIAARKLATISFPALESITGTLTIAGTSNTMFKNLSGFSILKSAAGVTISNFTQLSDFSPLAKVVCSLPNATAWKITGCGGTPANYSYETMQNTYCNND
jgi:hypothetical protein